MPWFETKCSFRVLGAAAFVLLAGLVIAPRPVEAACGDYVWLRGQGPRSGHAMADHAVQAKREQGGAVHQSQGPVMPRCRGPFCSNGSPPPAAPAPSTKVTFERWAACAEDSFGTDAIASAGLIRDVAERPADGFGQSILRPPR